MLLSFCDKENMWGIKILIKSFNKFIIEKSNKGLKM